ncbi:hypothetical protein E1J29_08745 [Xanthomonas hortorum pv. vitians]|nr:hypothetical protein [Xanthomonas hortorum pv. vitians]NMI43437.1 hypothetical protein [Xanthomonas hortorum pv. vitians]
MTLFGSNGADRTAAHRTAARLATMHTDTLDWSLPTHRRGTLCGMDAAEEPYLFGFWQFRCREPAWATVRAWIVTDRLVAGCPRRSLPCIARTVARVDARRRKAGQAGELSTLQA